MSSHTSWSTDQPTTCINTRHGLLISPQHVKLHVMVCQSDYNMSSHTSWSADQSTTCQVTCHGLLISCKMSSHMSWSADQYTKCHVTCHGLLISLQQVKSHVMVRWSIHNMSMWSQWLSSYPKANQTETRTPSSIQLWRNHPVWKELHYLNIQKIIGF